MNPTADLKKTALCGLHVALSAKMAPFGGWLMPIQYQGILKEHEACRTQAVVFDTCHMGEFLVRGPQAAGDLDRLVTCNVASLAVGQCRYGLMCNEAGGVIDDLLVYRTGEADYMVVVNAGTQDHDFEWLQAHLTRGTQAQNVSATTCKIDFQGPATPKLMKRLVERPVTDLKYYHFAENAYRHQRVLVSRTGYTGEIGFEIYFDDAVFAQAFWKDTIALGAVPAGLGARDTLRIEMGMPLYGHELGIDRNAADSGFTKAISANKNFVGAAAVRAGGPSRLVGVAIDGRSAARQGDTIKSDTGAEIGTVTSGSFAPSLGHAIAMGYVKKDAAVVGAKVMVQTARQELPGTIAATPFYKDGTARKPMAAFL